MVLDEEKRIRSNQKKEENRAKRKMEEIERKEEERLKHLSIEDQTLISHARQALQHFFDEGVSFRILTKITHMTLPNLFRFA